MRKGFPLQGMMYFEAYPNISEAFKNTSFLTLFMGEAWKWGKGVSEQMLSLKQGTRCVLGNAVNLRILTYESSWNPIKFQAVFHNLQRAHLLR